MKLTLTCARTGDLITLDHLEIFSLQEVAKRERTTAGKEHGPEKRVGLHIGSRNHQGWIVHESLGTVEGMIESAGTKCHNYACKKDCCEKPNYLRPWTSPEQRNRSRGRSKGKQKLRDKVDALGGYGTMKLDRA